MAIKSDKWIKEMAENHGMIEPFQYDQVKKNEKDPIVSYGTSSYGYDVRCSDEFKIFTNINSAFVDPKSFDEQSFVDVKSDVCIIPPNSFALASTVEYFKIPRQILTLCLGKSTYARCGLGTPPTVLEAGWHGNLVLEFSNHTSNSIKLYANSGAAQILFFKGDQPEVSYADRKGKYQGQVGITLAKSK